MTNLLIGVGFLVFGVVVMMLGVGVAYWFYRRQVSEEEEENSRFFAEGVRDRLREDSQFVFIIVASLLGVFAQQVSLAALLFFLAGLVLTAVSVKMAPPDWIEDKEDEEDEEDDPEPVPESDPQHIDPAGDLADAVESGDLDLSLADEQDAEDLREFVEAAESGELGPIDPGLEEQVRIVRALLDDRDGDTNEGDS
jgi:flagellar basal body-associated protein FliL